MTKATKRDYIDAASSVLSVEGAEGITVGKIAGMLGVTNAALYQHFRNLDHLVHLASLHFLVPYARDAEALFKQEGLNELELNLKLWESYSGYAFQNVPIFMGLFTKDTEEGLSSIFTEYYSIFPDELINMPSYFQKMMRGSSAIDREMMVLESAVDAGIISSEGARHLNKIDVYTLQGMLSFYQFSYKDEDIAASAAKSFMDTITYFARRELLPGKTVFGLGRLD